MSKPTNSRIACTINLLAYISTDRQTDRQTDKTLQLILIHYIV